MSEPFPIDLSSFEDSSQSAQFLQSLLESLPVCLTLLDAEGRVVFTNTRETTRAGSEPPSGLVGRSYFREVLSLMISSSASR
jgi:hypothetical protein